MYLVMFDEATEVELLTNAGRWALGTGGAPCMDGVEGTAPSAF